jgi:hypothetical protein
MLKRQAENFVKFWLVVPPVVLGLNCLEPDLRHIPASLDVYVGRLVLIRRIELEQITINLTRGHIGLFTA